MLNEIRSSYKNHMQNFRQIFCVLYSPSPPALIFFAMTFISSISSFVNKLKSSKSSKSFSLFGIGMWLSVNPNSRRVPVKIMNNNNDNNNNNNDNDNNNYNSDNSINKCKMQKMIIN